MNAALFQWQEANASREYHALCAALARYAAGRRPHALPPVKLALRLEFVGRREDDRRYFEDLHALCAAQRSTPHDRFVIARFITVGFDPNQSQSNDDPSLHELLQSGVPLVVGRDVAAPDNAAITIGRRDVAVRPPWHWFKADAAVVGLHIRRDDQTPGSFSQLCRHLSSAHMLKELHLEVNFSSTARENRHAIETLGDALFASKLCVETLTLHVVSPTKSTATALLRGAKRDKAACHQRIELLVDNRLPGPMEGLHQILRVVCQHTRQLVVRPTTLLTCTAVRKIMDNTRGLQLLDVGAMDCSDCHVWEEDNGCQPSASSALHTLAIAPVWSMSCEDGLSYPRRAVLEILRRVGHQLRCLRIEPRLEYNFLDAEFADALMLHCPRLEELQVKCVDATFVDRLLNGYRDHRCFLSTLDIEVRDTEVASLSNLFNALKDPRHAVTTTLQQLVVRVKRVRSTEFPQDLAHAIIEML
ncbi:hypothetical protein PINS_up012739 [Pythium insidiosum]|nr:hypothetical protein PINS_up012739 [Pythium insidiosum]